MSDENGRSKSLPTSPINGKSPLPGILTSQARNQNGTDAIENRSNGSRKLRFTKLVEDEGGSKDRSGLHSRGWETGKSDPGTPNISET